MSDSLLKVILKGRYEIIEQLGTGGFGDTYLALDHDLPKTPKRVVKHLAPKQLTLTELHFAQRLFQQEAELLNKLGEQHEQIPLLYAYFEDNGQFFLIQEFIEGHDLTQEIPQGQKLSEVETLDLLEEILSVLSFVHENGVIHRDIKPQNIMRRESDGKLFLIDFGAVKEINVVQTDSQGQTSLTVAIGSPGFMPNEQANGRPKLSSDVYAVGMIGVYCLTGIPPHQLEEDQQTGEMLWFHHTNVSEPVRQFIQIMIRDHFSQRFATAKVALNALRSLRSDLNRTKQVFNKSEPLTKSVRDEVQRRPAPVEKFVKNERNAAQKAPSTPTTASFSPTRSRRGFLTLLGLGGVGLSGTLLWGLTKNPIPKTKLEKTRVSSSLPTEHYLFNTVQLSEKGKIIERLTGEVEVYQEDLGNGVKLGMVLIPGGRFRMGSPSSERERDENESPQHEVTVPAFAIGQYQVTQAQWKALMGNNPSKFKGELRPVENVNWTDAIEFCKKLSSQTGKEYRLPSEAEWEYACRAQTATPFSFGETMTGEVANFKASATYALAPQGDNRQQTTNVGLFPPNVFGLYDMHGNVLEWCLDHWHETYTDAPTDGSSWVKGGNSDYRILRGGCWKLIPAKCRSAARIRFLLNFRFYYFGFRVALALPKNSTNM